MTAGTLTDKSRGSLAIFVLVYLVLSLGAVRTHYLMLDHRYHDERVKLHAEVMANEAAAPIQYRAPVFYLAEGLMRAGIPFDAAYGIIRGLFTFLAAVLFHLFLMRWFTGAGSFINVLFFFAALPGTFYLYYMQPQGTINLCFFMASLIAMRERKDFLLGVLLALSMFNRETPIVLIAAYLAYRHDELPPVTLLLRGAIYTVLCGAVYLGVRKYFGPHPYYSDFFFLKDNLTFWQSWAGVGLLFGVFLFTAWFKLSEKPKFLARAAAMVPFFFVIHWSVTKAWEPRLFLPLVPVIIPLAILSLFHRSPAIVLAPDAPRQDPVEEPTPVKNFISRTPALSFAVLFISFLLMFGAFCKLNADLHLKERTARELVNQASEAEKSGNLKEAEEILVRAIELDDSNAIAHMSLGIVLLKAGRTQQAIGPFERALELDPDGPYSGNIRRQLEALKNPQP